MKKKLTRLVLASIAPCVLWTATRQEAAAQAPPVRRPKNAPTVTEAPAVPTMRTAAVSPVPESVTTPAQSSPVPIPTPAAMSEAEECLECAPSGGFWRGRLKPWLQASHWGYREEFCPRPFGVDIHTARQAQIVAGRAAQYVLYQYDFQLDGEEPGAQLNAAGLRRLSKIAGWLNDYESPVIIEQVDGRPNLNAARRMEVTAQLRRLGIANAKEIVVVGSSPAFGRWSDEATEIQNNLMRKVQAGGVMSSSGSSSSGSSSSGGSSGSFGSSGTGSAGR